ncbi:MAG TPA: phage tail tape measure protein, partial [Parvibaculum sp.]
MTDTNDPVALTSAMEGAAAATRAFGAETTRTLSGVTSDYKRAASGGRDFGRTLTGAFDDVALRGKSLSDTLQKLALNLSKLVLNNAVNSIGSSVGNSFGSSFASMAGSLFASADGNV